MPPFKAPKQPKASPEKSTFFSPLQSHRVTIVSGQCTIGVSTKLSVWLPSSRVSPFFTSTWSPSMP